MNISPISKQNFTAKYIVEGEARDIKALENTLGFRYEYRNEPIKTFKINENAALIATDEDAVILKEKIADKSLYNKTRRTIKKMTTANCDEKTIYTSILNLFFGTALNTKVIDAKNSLLHLANIRLLDAVFGERHMSKADFDDEKKYW